MCTFCFLMLVTTLVRGRRMGNKISTVSTKDSKGFIHVHTSEEEYVPMPKTLRKRLVDGRRLQRVPPYRQTLTKTERMIEDIDSNEKKIVDNGNEITPSLSSVIKSNSKSGIEVESKLSCDITEKQVNTFTVPLVTVINTIKLEDKSRSLPSTTVGSEKQITVRSPTMKSMSPTAVTNRKFSLIDLGTGLNKSQFTLDLEEKLRQSKLELGFDTDLSEWKEFTFKLESPRSEGKKRLSLEKGVQVGVDNKDIHLCNNNCQVLGLCSVGRTEPFRETLNFEPSLFKEELNRKYDVKDLMKSHSKKIGCPCNSCTMSYLTNMGNHIPQRKIGRITRKKKPRNCHSSNCEGNNKFNEKIYIKESINNSKSIEVIVKSSSSNPNTHCSKILPETDEDCTNSRIKKMFNQNKINSSDIKEIYTNRNSSGNDISVERFITNNGSKILRSCKNMKRSSHNYSSSPGMQSTTSSSSLSTVLSYKRVRHIFQNIIEGSRCNKKTKINLNKYKEMEELGLGRLRNNRWYPSGYKTFSIWKDMNNNVGGFEAEFKPRHKTIPVK